MFSVYRYMIITMTMYAFFQKNMALKIQYVPSRWIRPLYGEWVIRHSNHPCFSSFHDKSIVLFPNHEIMVQSYQIQGPFVFYTEKIGTFRVECYEREHYHYPSTKYSTISNFKYTDDIQKNHQGLLPQGGIEETKEGTRDSICHIELDWKWKKKTVHTFLGISIRELSFSMNRSFRSNQENDKNNTISLQLDLWDTDQLFLSDPSTKTFVNLYRSTRLFEPDRGTPLSAFIATQVFGSILLHVLHQISHDWF